MLNYKNKKKYDLVKEFIENTKNFSKEDKKFIDKKHLDIINTFEKANNTKVNYSIGPRRNGDVEQIYANGNLIKVRLGWEAKETLEQAIKSAWEWEKNKQLQ